MPIAIESSSYPEIMILKASNPLTPEEFEIGEQLGLDKKLLYLILDATGANIPEGVLSGKNIGLAKYPYLLHMAVVVDQAVTFQPTAKVSLHHSFNAAFKHITNLREMDNPPTL